MFTLYSKARLACLQSFATMPAEPHGKSSVKRLLTKVTRSTWKPGRTHLLWGSPAILPGRLTPIQPPVGLVPEHKNK